MDFAAAWDAFATGDGVTVSNDQVEPGTLPDSLAMKIWRSHNFTGALAEKVSGARRRLRFNLPPDADGNVIGYLVAEEIAHTFTAA